MTGARGELGCQTDSGETGKGEHTSADTQGCWQAGWPEVEPRSAGSGLVELQRASHTLGWNLGGTWGIRQREKGARVTRSPEAVPGTKARGKSRTGASHGWCQMLRLLL